MARILFLSLCFLPIRTAAQTHTSLTVQVEITAPSMTLSISSSRINFGQVSQNAGDVYLDPVTGERSGTARGTYSVAGILLQGEQGSQYIVQVSPPADFTGSGARAGEPDYTLRWAQSHHCAGTGFIDLPAAPSVRDVLGESGCARIQVGGVLTPNSAPIGFYSGAMTIQIMQL